MRLIDADDLKKNFQDELCKGIACAECSMQAEGFCRVERWIDIASTVFVECFRCGTFMQPTAEPTKHAHDLTDKARYFYCSECGYAVADVFEGAYHHDERVRIFEEGRSWSYCPNCGARMINEVEE